MTEQEKIELDKFGSKVSKRKTETLKKLYEMLGKAVDMDDKDLINIATAAINNELTRPEFRQAYRDITSKDSELADRFKAKSGNFSSTISAVGKRYIKERKWNKQSTKSGATTAIKRFVNFIGGNKDISDINEKHAHSFAKWMEDELGSANKSIKSSTS